ncbi:MAG: hypothetical protein QNK26_14670, partial [Moritella sp.]|uniref:hypothetical protein n=1 Tax=Moritella sp. TaxID=78556 RepID=UPI0029BEDEC6
MNPEDVGPGEEGEGMEAGEGGGLPPAGGGPAEMGAPPDMGASLGGGAVGGMPSMAEGHVKLSEEDFNKHLEKLVYGSSQEPVHKNEENHKKVIHENNNINDNLNKNAQAMISEIDDLLVDSESINKIHVVNEAEDIDLGNIEDIEL